MRILFICGFLEKGACGVGDYTRRLAGRLISEGHHAAVIAINDMFIEEKYEGKHYDDGFDIPVLRIPSSWPKVERFNVAEKWINKFEPDWLSLQLVLFSFQEKGLPFGLGTWLLSIGRGRRWNIMFHELWVGMEKEASLKMVLWGLTQKVLIKSIINKLRPEVVFTQSQLHQFALGRLNVTANLLPLFSNIPVIEAKAKQVPELRSTNLSFVFFGSIYKGAPIAEFANEAATYAKKHGIEVKFIAVGKNRETSEDWINACRAEGLIVQLLGEQPAKRISDVLRNASYGISTTPYILAEKSGTVMALREHGLPVICVSRIYSIRGLNQFQPIPGIKQYEKGKFNSCLITENIETTTSINYVSFVANQFIRTLESNSINCSS